MHPHQCSRTVLHTQSNWSIGFYIISCIFYHLNSLSSSLLLWVTNCFKKMNDPNSNHMVWKFLKMSYLRFEVWHFSSIFVLLKYHRKLQALKKSHKKDHFGHFSSTFGHSKCKRDFFCDFQTSWVNPKVSLFFSWCLWRSYSARKLCDFFLGQHFALLARFSSVCLGTWNYLLDAKLFLSLSTLILPLKRLEEGGGDKLTL